MAAKSAKILIVDDSPINREIYRNAIKDIPNVEVFSVDRGVEALNLVQLHDFAVYLIDIVMPGIDGFELASLLREEKNSETTPILFVTSHDPDPDLMMRGYRMGAVDYLVRVPVDVEILVRKVKVFLRLYWKRLELAETLQEAEKEIKELHLKLEEYMSEHEQLRKAATHDALTGLPNRALFQDRLELAVRRSQRNRQRFALAYIDLDGFKAVNDQYGHAAGDEFLAATAQRLMHTLRGVDTAARLGGDEFGVLLEGLDSVAGAEYAAGKMYAALVQPLDLLCGSTGGQVVRINPRASVGLAIFPDHASVREELITLADMNMYEAKRANGGLRLHRPRLPGETHLQVVGGRAGGEESKR